MANSRTPEDPILSRIYALYDECRWPECIEACVNAIESHVEASVDQWYVMHTVLASSTTSLEGDRRFQDAIATAIPVMERLVDSNRLLPSDERRGLASRTLGYLFSKADRGNAEGDLRRSVEHYRRAVSILRPERTGQDWAEASVGLGTQLLASARMLTREQIIRDAEEIESTRNSVNSSISAFEKALEIYTEQDHPEERQTVVELIAAAHRILDILNRHERMLH